MCLADMTDTTTYARVAQLVEHDLAKVGVAGSSPVSRSLLTKKDIRWMSFFVKSSPAGPGRSRSTLRSGRRRAEAKIIFPPKELIVSVLHSCFSFISS